MRDWCLVVDDDRNVRDSIEQQLGGLDVSVTGVETAEEALQLAGSEPWCLAICKDRLPDSNGAWLIDQLARRAPATATVLASSEPEDDRSALDAPGFLGVLTTPAPADALAAVLLRAREWHRDARQRLASREHIEEAVHACAANIVRAASGDWLSLVGRASHVGYRIARMSQDLGHHLGLDGAMLDRLSVGALLHDLTRALLPASIATKAGPLNAAEEAVVRGIPLEVIGMLAELGVRPVDIATVRSVWERPDGRGYPDGLAGSLIPLPSRIIAVVTACDAMQSPRPYRQALTWTEMEAELAAGAGTQFDAQLAQLALKSMRWH